jgi:hypothetical protein
MTELDLRETLERHVGAVDVPPADPSLALSRGRQLRRRRRGLAGLCVAGAVAVAVAGGVSVMTSEEPGRGLDTTGSIALGDLDFAHGARAYADPGRELHLAGRTFPADGLPFLDTDAVATAYGIVFYRAGRPVLLAADGRDHPLVAGDVDAGDGFRPTVKADSVNPWVAYATRQGGTAVLTVHDLRTGQDVATTTIDGLEAGSLVVDALDDGVVYVRTDQLTRAWDTADGTWRTVYDGGGRVVDVRGGVMLYDGKPPADIGLSRVPAPIDATLTFDGEHVLDWSSRLRSTDGGPDLVLDQGPTGKGLGFWAIDSDGSVLVARPEGAYPNYLVYDCDAGSGACEELGPLRTTGGDPEFIGVDM